MSSLLILGFSSLLGTEKAEAEIVIEEFYLFVIYHYYTAGTGQRPISSSFSFLFWMYLKVPFLFYVCTLRFILLKTIFKGSFASSILF